MGAPTHSISCHHRSLFLVNDTQDNTLKASIIPTPAPLPSCSQLQLIPCVDILTRLNIPALLCNSTTTRANTVAQQLRVLHNDQLTIGGNTGRLQDANAEILRGTSDKPGCSWAVKTLFWGSEDSSHIISYFTYCILVVLLSQKTKVIWISPTWFSHSKWLKPSNLPTFSICGDFTDLI